MKKATSFLKEASGYVVTRTLIGAPRIDLDLFLANISGLLHHNVPIDELEQRFNSHALTLDTNDLDFMADEGIEDIRITEIHSGDEIENYSLTFSWEKLLTPIQATAIGGMSSKVLNYRVKASLVALGNADIEGEDGSIDARDEVATPLGEETLDEAKVTMNDFVTVKLKNLPPALQKKAQEKIKLSDAFASNDILFQDGQKFIFYKPNELEKAKKDGLKIIITEETNEDEIKNKLKDITKGEFIDGYSVDGATVNISVEDNTSKEDATKVKEKISKILNDSNIKITVGE